MAAYVPGAISGLFAAKKAVGEDGLFSKPIAESIPVAQAIKPASSTSAVKEHQKRPVSKKKAEAAAAAVKPKNSPEQDLRTLFVGNIPLTREEKAAEEEEDGDDEAKSSAAALKSKDRILKKLEKRIRSTFSQFGPVESVRFRGLGIAKVRVESGSKFNTMRRVAAIKSSLDERVESCIGYVVFKSKESVDKALASVNGGRGLAFEGNHLRLDRVRVAEAEQARGSGDNDEEDGQKPASGGDEDGITHKGVVFERKRTVFVGGLVFECTEEEVRNHFDAALQVEGDDEKPCVSVRIIRDPKTNLGKGFCYVLLSHPTLVKRAIDTLDGSMIRTRAIRVTKCERSSQKKDEKNAKKREADKLAEAQGLPSAGAQARLAKKQKQADKKANKAAGGGKSKSKPTPKQAPKQTKDGAKQAPKRTKDNAKQAPKRGKDDAKPASKRTKTS